MCCRAAKSGTLTPRRVYRLYQLEGFSLSVEQRKKRVSRFRIEQPQETAPENLLRSVSGVATVTVSTLLACLPELGTP